MLNKNVNRLMLSCRENCWMLFFVEKSETGRKAGGSSLNLNEG